MKRILNERGALPILAIVLVVVAVVAGGLVVYNASKSHDRTAQTVNSSTSPSPSSSPAAAASTEPTPATGSYLDIKELGIKIELTYDIKDVVYAMVGSNMAKISSQSIINVSADCTAGAVGPLGTVGKTTNPNQGFGTLIPNNETVFKFGSYYVYYQTPQSPCGNSQAVLDTAAKQRQSFQQAFKTVQPDN
jgi:hypothetical protein